MSKKEKNIDEIETLNHTSKEVKTEDTELNSLEEKLEKGSLSGETEELNIDELKKVKSKKKEW